MADKDKDKPGTPYDFGNPQWVVLGSDVSTPPEIAQYAGRFFALPGNASLPDGFGVIVISGVTLPGYAATINGQLTWMMQPAQSPIVQAFDAIPGPGGWEDQQARSVFAGIGLALMSQGIGGHDVVQGLQQMYNAAIADYVARQD